MGGSTGGSSGKSTQRYAGYVEDKHSDFLDAVAEYRSSLTDSSPFSDYEIIDIDIAFFGSGLTLASYTALFDLFGEYMSGLDVSALWREIFEDTTDSPVVDSLIAAEITMLDDDMENTAIPRLQTGMRDINSVISSSFIVGKAMLEDTRTKAIAKFDADVRYRMVSVAESRWQTTLQWNHQVVMTYAELLKLYFLTKTEINETNYSMLTRNLLWPFTVLEYERAALGALQGAITTTTEAAGTSKVAKGLSGALAGAAGGAYIGAQLSAPQPLIGAAVGAAVGGLAGIFS